MPQDNITAVRELKKSKRALAASNCTRRLQSKVGTTIKSNKGTITKEGRVLLKIIVK